LHRFEHSVALGRAALADEEPDNGADHLREALAVWRGPALADLPEEARRAAGAEGLDELRLTALELRFDAELASGRHDAVVAELEMVTTEHPYRERFLEQRVLALYRCGRQADALEAYRNARRILDEELGLEPSPALQELERAILRQDEALTEQRGQPRSRGSIVCAVPSLAGLVAPLATEERELVLVDLVADASELRQRSAALTASSDARTAAFVSDTPGADLARLAVEQNAELLLCEPPELPELDLLLGRVQCDVALLGSRELPFRPDAPVVVPFGGGREDWAALELAAWIARAHELELRLLGTEAQTGRRDASRLLASASLALQQFAGTNAEPVLVPPGPDGILAEESSVIVVSFPAHGFDLDRTRVELLDRTKVPLLLVRGGLRPSGLAPEETLTRFSWSMRDD
jgi:hypothetical protein